MKSPFRITMNRGTHLLADSARRQIQQAQACMVVSDAMAERYRPGKVEEMRTAINANVCDTPAAMNEALDAMLDVQGVKPSLATKIAEETPAAHEEAEEQDGERWQSDDVNLNY